MSELNDSEVNFGVDYINMFMTYLKKENTSNMTIDQYELCYRAFSHIAWTHPKAQEIVNLLKNNAKNNALDAYFEKYFNACYYHNSIAKSVENWTLQAWLEDFSLSPFAPPNLKQYIKNTNQIKWFNKYLTGGSVALLLMGIISILENIPSSISLLRALSATVTLTSFLRLLWRIGYETYSYFFDKKLNLTQNELALEWQYTCMGMIFYVLACALLVCAATTTVPVALLFVLASLVEVFREKNALDMLFSDVSLFYQGCLSGVEFNQIYFEEKKNKIIINILAALCITAAVAVTVFCPVLSIIIASVVFMSLIYGIQYNLLSNNQKNTRIKVHQHGHQFFSLPSKHSTHVTPNNNSIVDNHGIELLNYP